MVLNLGEWFRFRSINTWIFSHRTDIDSNMNGKSLAFCYKYSLVISSDCYSHLISIHSVYFQMSAVWDLTLIYRQWTHPSNGEHASLHQSFVVNVSPAPRACSTESDLQTYRDFNKFWKLKSLDRCHKDVTRSRRWKESLGWKCEQRIPNT